MGMEFNEKLKELRKSRGLTQEELAEALYVSRTAVSKWESGRGYPGIDSLKEIAAYFSVTVDELLSAEKIITIAEKENRSNIRGMCDFIFGIVDIFSFILILLPLYPNRVGEYINSVNLFAYTDASPWIKAVCWTIFTLLIVLGVLKIAFTKLEAQKHNKVITVISMLLGCFAVLFFALTRQAYVVILAFLLLAVKVFLLYRYQK